MTPTPASVRRRRVFYIPGYDPIPPRRYRELYRSEGRAQAAISGFDLVLIPKQAGGPYGWQVSTRTDGVSVETSFDVLVWSDIVRASMGHSIAATYLQLLRTVGVYIGSGALWRLMRLRKGPIIAALYPVIMLLAQLGLAVLAGWVIAAAALWLLPPAPLGQAAGWALGALALGGVLRWFRAKDHRFYAYYLMHDYAFSAQSGGAYPPALETRMARFGTAIAQALNEDWDEVLVVGHSSGAHLAVSVLADLIRQGRVPASTEHKYPGGAGGAPPPACLATPSPNAPQAATLALLTLGQVVPMVSFLPRAQRLRGDLRYLSARPELVWVDVTAPGDGCAFALCDPVAVTGVAPPDKRWPLVLSAAFSQSLSPERWARLRRRFFRLHFQYLCAFDRPRGYDYFQITAGPLALADLARDRAPSKSRIERAANRYTDCA